MVPVDSLGDFLRQAADLWAASPALFAPGREPLTYAGLLASAESTAAALNLPPASRVALVAPNGPEAVTAFLGIAASACCAPLNPSYRAEEFRFYLSDLQPRALIVDRTLDSPCLAVAAELGIPVLEFEADASAPAGLFQLAARGAATPRFASPAETALVLHTSGTTSRPKVVPLSGANLCASARNIARTFALTPQDRTLNVMPLFHIHGLVAAVLGSLFSGGSVVCTPGFLAPRFFDWLAEFQPTWYTAVPTMHQAVLARAPHHQSVLARSSLRFIRSCSAALPPQLMLEMETVFGVPVLESYGMTEAAHQMASNPLPPDPRKPGSVGRAAGPEVAIMDADGRLLPATAKGEVVIRGANVTAGYEANPQANAASFTAGWFRTGDEGYLDHDGYLFLTGRLKEMINRGGEKIAPREIDEALMDHPAVAQAVAFSVPDPKLGEEIAAVVVLRPGSSVTEEQLQQFVAARLADFKVPRSIVFRNEIPKGPTGKLQRIGLAAKLGLDSAPAAAPAASSRAPQGEAECRLAAIFAEVLGIAGVPAETSFFDLGGDSILAAQAAARVRQAFSASCTLLDLFRAPSVAALAARLAAPHSPEPDAAPRPGEASGAGISFAQQRMFFLDRYEHERALYNRPALFRLSGPVDAAALGRAFAALIERHPTLRTAFIEHDGRISAFPRPPAAGPLVLAEAPSPEAAIAAARLDFDQPFDLASGHLLRATLYRLAAEDHILAVNMHHIASDGWSSRIFFRELAALYAGQSLPPLALSYPDYAVWQQRRLSGQRLEDLAAWWRETLAGAPALLPMPTDLPRPALQAYRAGRVTTTLSPGLTARLKSLARDHDATLFMVLLAGFQTLLARYSGAEDLVVATPVAGRLSADLEPLVGLFVNTLPVRVSLAGDPSFAALLDRVRDASLGAMAHEEMPFERLVELLGIPRSLSHSPLCQAIFQLRNVPLERVPLPGCRMEEVDHTHPYLGFDLSLEANERDGGIRFDLSFRQDLFLPATAARLLAHLECLFEAAAASPLTPVWRLPLLSAAERHMILEDWNSASAPVDPLPIWRRIDLQAEAAPDLPAITCGGTTLTRSDVRAASRRIAAALQSAGVSRGGVVGVVMDRSLWLAPTFLAIWKLGASYLPLDPSFPPARLAFMASDASLQAVVTERASLPAVPPLSLPVLTVEDLPATLWTEPEPFDDSSLVSYLIYTSGSTGQPKASLVTQGGLRVFLAAARVETGIGPADRFLTLFSPSFDGSVFAIFHALSTGTPLTIATRDEVRDGERLRALLQASAPTVVNGSATSFSMLLDAGWIGPSTRILTGGEWLTRSLANRILASSAGLMNTYGPTETTVWCTSAVISAGDGPVVIGKASPNYRVYILDRHLEPAPIGVAGEIFIGGPAVSLGYLNRPELTAERFLPDPFLPGARMYRSGDLARFLPSGDIEFLGRTDDQVKLRGLRIELGEIESVLAAQPGIRSCACVIRPAAEGLDQLAAFYVPLSAPLPEPRLRAVLLGHLPEYMVPACFIAVEELPLTPNGKVDRLALAARRPSVDGSLPAEPMSPVEQIVAGHFATLLDRPSVSLDDNFFSLGGHSLLVLRAVARLNAEFGVSLPLRAFFARPSVRGVALAVVEAMLAGEEA